MRERGAAGREYDTVSWMLYVDLRSYFEGSILFNSTKIVKGTGLDIRMPLCDLRMFDIARRMPTRFKGGRRAEQDRVAPCGESRAARFGGVSQEAGFPVPISGWLADPAYNADILRAFKSEAAAKFFNMREIQALLSMFLGEKTNLWHRLRYRGNKAGLWRRVWSIYVFIRWYELFFMDGERS